MSTSPLGTLPVKAPPVPLQPTSFSRREWVFRVLIVSALCASATLAWWTLKVRLLPLQKQSRELAARVARASTEVDELERQWPQARQEGTARRLAQAHKQLFGNQAELEAWLSQLKEQSDPLRLETKAVLGQSIPKLTGEEEVAVIPSTVSVEVHSAGQDRLEASAYQRVLRLAQRLSERPRRADLAELSVAGGTNSVSNVELVFHLWAGEGGKR